MRQVNDPVGTGELLFIQTVSPTGCALPEFLYGNEPEAALSLASGRDRRNAMVARRNAERGRMLELYGRIGRALYAVRVLFLVGTAAGAAFFVGAILDKGAAAQEIRLLLPLLVCLWSLCMAVFAYGFSGKIPVVDPATGWRRRLMARIQRVLWHALALTMTVLGLAIILFTLRAITTMRAALGSL